MRLLNSVSNLLYQVTCKASAETFRWQFGDVVLNDTMRLSDQVAAAPFSGLALYRRTDIALSPHDAGMLVHPSHLHPRVLAVAGTA